MCAHLKKLLSSWFYVGFIALHDVHRSVFRCYHCSYRGFHIFLKHVRRIKEHQISLTLLNKSIELHSMALSYLPLVNVWLGGDKRSVPCPAFKSEQRISTLGAMPRRSSIPFLRLSSPWTDTPGLPLRVPGLSPGFAALPHLHLFPLITPLGAS